jgi:hypothetical protein
LFAQGKLLPGHLLTSYGSEFCGIQNSSSKCLKEKIALRSIVKKEQSFSYDESKMIF